MSDVTVVPESLVPGLTGITARPAAPRFPPVLFVHGMFGGAWYFEWWQRRFAERGWPSHAVDLRGHHGSGGLADAGHLSLRHYVDDALAAARALGCPAVVGHSMGGLVAQKVAEAGAARAVALLCPAPPRGISPLSALLARKMLRYVRPLLTGGPLVGRDADHAALSLNRVPPEQHAALAARFVAESGRAGLEMTLGTVAVDARRVRCPVLCVAAEHDRFIVPRIVRRIARKYDAPLLELAGHGHFVVMEPGWERAADEVERWLAGAVEGRGAELCA